MAFFILIGIGALLILGILAIEAAERIEVEADRMARDNEQHEEVAAIAQAYCDASEARRLDRLTPSEREEQAKGWMIMAREVPEHRQMAIIELHKLGVLTPALMEELRQ